jgi:hypothetical protein
VKRDDELISICSFRSFFLVGIPVLSYFIFGVPYERGFNCNDESLMYPFRESTVTHEVLYTVGFGVPLLCVCSLFALGIDLRIKPIYAVLDLRH